VPVVRIQSLDNIIVSGVHIDRKQHLKEIISSMVNG